MAGKLRSLVWGLLVVGVICGFFHECLFRGFSLVPTDLLHQLMLPYSASVTNVAVKNHYANDALTTDYPLGIFWQDSVRSGQLPLWNPHILGGHPNLADSWTAVLSPFKLLYLILPAERAFTLGIILQFVLAGVFMFALLREVGRSRPASFIGGCAWALNSSFLMWYWRSPGILCWAPLVLLLMERAARRDSWGHVLAAGVTLGVAFLSGNIQSGVHLGFLCACYGGSLVAWGDPARRRKTLSRVMIVLIVGAFISAVQSLPALQLLARDAMEGTQVRGTRASLRHTVLGIPCLITFLFPGLTGSTESYDLLKLASTTRSDLTGYIGVVPFVLALMAAIGVRERRVRYLAGIIVAVVAIQFFTPLVKYLYHRFFIVAVCAASMLAAYGADMLIDSSPERRRVIRRTLATMVAVCVTLSIGLLVVSWIVAANHDALVAMAQRVIAGRTSYAFAYKTDWFHDRLLLFLDHYRLSNVVFWLPILCVLGVAALWWARIQEKVARVILCAGVLLATVVDLTVLGRQLVPQMDLQTYPLQPAHPTLAPVQADHELFRVVGTSVIPYYTFRPNWLMAARIQDVSGNISLAPENIASLFPALDPTYEFNALLKLLNVKYLFTSSTNSLPSDRFDLLVEADGLRTYRNKHWLPRARFVTQWEIVPDRSQILPRMRAEGFNPAANVFLEEHPSIAPSGGDAAATVQMRKYTPLHVVVEVQCGQPGMLVLADTWYPGWKARVDGISAPLYRADWVLRAVAVPAGEHRVEFYYAPATVIIGGSVSLATAGVALLMMVLLHVRGRRHST